MRPVISTHLSLENLDENSVSEFSAHQHKFNVQIGSVTMIFQNNMERRRAFLRWRHWQKRQFRNFRDAFAIIAQLGLSFVLCLGTYPAYATGQLYLTKSFPEHFNQTYATYLTVLPDGTIFNYSSCATGWWQCFDDRSKMGIFTEVSVWNSDKMEWERTSVSDFRTQSSSTLTSDGRIFLIGGSADLLDFIPLASTAVYDSHSHSYRSGPNLDEPRFLHAATALPGGEILVTGGETGAQKTTSGVELIGINSHKTVPAMLQDRCSHTATLLPSGDVLVVGGLHFVQIKNSNRLPEPFALNTVELYSQRENRWKAMPPMPASRYGHTATLLPDGRVMIIGGHSGDWENRRAVAKSVLLWNPANNQWTTGSDLAQGHTSHNAILLPSGDVLVGGGYDEVEITSLSDIRQINASHALELWDHSTGSWSNAGRLKAGHVVASLLPDGNVLFYPDRSAQTMAIWSALPGAGHAGNLSTNSSDFTDAVSVEWTSASMRQGSPLYFLTASHPEFDINDRTGFRRHWEWYVLLFFLAIFLLVWKKRRAIIRHV